METFRSLNREVSGWIFWPVIFGVILVLAPLAISMR
jgi:hypothetical protein